jgi:heme/copper-type cytochrome/quinol oxidase subunit 3
MTNEDFIGRKTLDVSELPSTMFDDKANLWWGNNWGLAIETTVFGILVALYFSVRMSISQWLPPRTTPGLPFCKTRCLILRFRPSCLSYF